MKLDFQNALFVIQEPFLLDVVMRFVIIAATEVLHTIQECLNVFCVNLERIWTRSAPPVFIRTTVDVRVAKGVSSLPIGDKIFVMTASPVNLRIKRGQTIARGVILATPPHSMGWLIATFVMLVVTPPHEEK
jgi:hypothetical protein